MSFVQVQTTFKEEKDALVLADQLLKEKLAACIQIIPMRSIYKWKEKTMNEQEFMCLIKTKESIIDEVINFIKDNHPYDVPEVIVTPIIGGSSSYLDWINEETK